ncbi:MAG: transglutaminase family protein [Acidobacteria bacterium]|nr:transglutaminase family protein [Acidobacteriota bacterium]
MSLHEYLQSDPGCRGLAEGAVHAVSPLLANPDPGPTLRLLEAWSHELAGRMPLPWNLHQALDELNGYLFRDLDFRGDVHTYDDPANAALPLVIQRRRGLPIALAILWIDLGRRLGLDAVGIGLPGHFLAGLRTEMGTLCFDPFHQGRAVGEEEAARLVEGASGGRLPFNPSMLQPISHRAVLARLVRNLHVRYRRQEAWAEALWSATHLILLEPENPETYRERARANLRLGNRDQALEDLETSLRLEPDAAVAAWVEGLRRG